MFKRKTIFSRLFLSYSFIIILSFLLFIGVFFYLYHLSLYKEYEDTFQHHYEQVEKQLKDPEQMDRNAVETFTYNLDQPGYHIYLADETGKQVFGPDPDQDFEPIDITEEMVKQVIAGETVSEGGFYNGELRYVVASTLRSDLPDLDTVIMVVIFDDLTHEYQQVLWMILITFLIALFFAGIILWFISRKITAPLREMNEMAHDYAKGDFSKSVQYESKDEIGQLASSFTNMAKELNHLENRRKQYISNVSHELRSPLTSIKGFLIALLDGTIPDHRRTHYYNIMKMETERMIKLVNDTLDMTQLEEGNSKLMRTDYNLTEQIDWIIHKLEPQFSSRHLDVHFNKEVNYYVNADQARIEQVIVNLLHNAVQFSKTNGKIDLSLEKDGENVRVTIQDYGEGMEQDHLDLIWRRFYKVDEARTNKSGAGLGLAIVKSILDLHESEIQVQSEKGIGTVFTFTLPLSK